MNVKRKLIEAVEPRKSAVPALRDCENWTPLHPMHIDLTGRMSTFPPPVVPRFPRPVRAAITIGLAAASWALLWSSATAMVHLFAR